MGHLKEIEIEFINIIFTLIPIPGVATKNPRYGIFLFLNTLLVILHDLYI